LRRTGRRDRCRFPLLQRLTPAAEIVFDETQNRALGRAYLAQMFRHYGSWPDAIAAYNWGPARIDRWITGGRLFDKLPPAVARYQTRVLAESGAFAGITTRLGRLRLLRLEAKRQLIERRHHGYRPEAVELLYAEIMRATSGPVEMKGEQSPRWREL
jgi:hypothetical protein